MTSPSCSQSTITTPTTTQRTTPRSARCSSATAATARRNTARRNAELLAAYAQQRTLEHRNAVVHANLPLVWQVARQESLRSRHDYDDLVQVGYLGLIQAVERFDLRRGTSLSSAAVPWIRGAIRHHLRDHCRPLSGSHHLLDLCRRGRRLQVQREQQGLPPLPAPLLAAELGCSEARWQQALALRQALQPGSLDQTWLDGNGDRISLMELLAAPTGDNAYERAIRQEQRRQLWRSLRKLERHQRRLLLERVLRQRSWRALGEPLGWSAKVTQKHGEQLLLALRQDLLPQLGVG